MYICIYSNVELQCEYKDAVDVRSKHFKIRAEKSNIKYYQIKGVKFSVCICNASDIPEDHLSTVHYDFRHKCTFYHQ